ncbi:MAG: hypothetical protein Q7I97_04170 [Thermovirgaceae bacterium]|nr:hypothetical protein [Thermovirgaceae bacterium]
MTPADPSSIDHGNPDAEIESFRRDLESRLDGERIKLKEEQYASLRRIEELSENSLVRAAFEWNEYEILLVSSREKFLKKSKEEMFRLFSSRGKYELDNDRIKAVLETILPMADPYHEEGNGN